MTAECKLYNPFARAASLLLLFPSNSDESKYWQFLNMNKHHSYHQMGLIRDKILKNSKSSISLRIAIYNQSKCVEERTGWYFLYMYIYKFNVNYSGAL